MAVNVSPRTLLDDRLVETVRRLLADLALPPGRLQLEVVESRALHDLPQVLDRLEALRHLGVRLALDDFGTGYSTLAWLQALPVDTLKVDKSFVDTITRAGRHAVIATALIQVADGLGLHAVAEGVETAEQAAELHRLGYRLAQGYHFGRPVPEPDFCGVPRALAG